MKLFVTVLEETCQAALHAIAAIADDHDGVEVRAERFPSIDLPALRAATPKPIILTYRTTDGREAHGVREVRAAALQAGIDFVDVEWHPAVDVREPSRTVLSHHDYEGMLGVEEVFERMSRLGCAHVKLAATPRSFADNERLLRLLGGEPASGTVIGMGELGLYSRILAPFRGSALTFVAATNAAAPGQLTLERALAIYGPHRESLCAERVFAVVGRPAGHSLSPVIHNRLFRATGVSAAYTIASVERFDDVIAAFLGGEPCGLSVTAPFKDEAFGFAVARNAQIGANAMRTHAVNTLVNLGGSILADNTDVDGFAALLPRARKAAVVGAGGTARAALVALEDAGIPATCYNRTPREGVLALEELSQFDGDLLVDTLPPGADVPLPRCRTIIQAAYGANVRAADAATHIGGVALLEAQAVRQHELFMKGFDDL